MRAQSLENFLVAYKASINMQSMHAFAAQKYPLRKSIIAELIKSLNYVDIIAVKWCSVLACTVK